MDWWSELWLNEGFATWVGWLAVDHFYPGIRWPQALTEPEKLTIFLQIEWNIWSQFVVRNSRGNKHPAKNNVDVITG